MFKKFDFKARIMLIYITTVTLVAMILGVYMYIRSYQETKNATVNTYKHSAELLVNRLDDYLQNYQTISFMLSSDGTLMNLRSESHDLYDIVLALNNHIEPDIYFFLNQNPVISDVTIYVENSVEIPSRFFAELNAFTSSKWYEKTQKNSMMQLVNIDNSLKVISPITNHANSQPILGYVCLDINTDLLFTNALKEYKNIEMRVTSLDGKILFNSSNKEDIFISSLNPTNGDMSIDFYVDKQLIAISPASIFAPIFLMLGIAILAGLMLFFLLQRHLFERITRIAYAVDHIDLDTLAINIDDDQDDEIGKLTTCINKMSQRIQHLVSSLYEVKQKQLLLELESLQVRVDPHFLYNIMDTINWIAMEGDFERICEISRELSTYYRTNLNDGKSITTLKKELENLQSYLNLQMIAMSHSFDVEYEIEEDILDYEICNCTLQPLVENAVLHGIKPLKGSRGKIIIRFVSDEEHLWIYIIDNGVGLSQKSFFPQRSGYGIHNVRERIKLYFGSEYDVIISPNNDAPGTCATVHIPKKYSQP